jgi:hypothetical protein
VQIPQLVPDSQSPRQHRKAAVLPPDQSKLLVRLLELLVPVLVQVPP